MRALCPVHLILPVLWKYCTVQLSTVFRHLGVLRSKCRPQHPF